MTTSKKLLIGRKKTKGSQTMNEAIRIVSKGNNSRPWETHKNKGFTDRRAITLHSKK